eukprot:TRINITY_DN12370_c0_g1_i1.p1 TRINITY_DN12370_c0_g1~~TRINITY_DN12370_c0_g1_i1.p1  ORF type:complete len:176 (+),score=50.88 TRINITY_DN12370_c0_g1_i1:42-569(+)
MSLYTIKAVFVLDSNGDRLLAKYFPIDPNLNTKKEQETFEKNLFQKTHRQNAQIILLDKYVVLYKSSSDVIFYVVGSSNENELILLSALEAYTDALSTLLRNTVDKRSIVENMDYVLLALDELVDGGILLESEAQLIAQRASLKQAGDSELPIAEQTLSQALQTAKKQFAKNFIY